MQTTRIQAGLNFLIVNTISVLFFDIMRPQLILELKESDMTEKHLKPTI
jgi:hypothetical protein